MTTFEPVIGLEIHSQLLTATKIFCGCPTTFGSAPNTNVCPVCLGLPGALPVLNRHAVTLAIRAALALGCTVHETSIFARKNYFYPDLPKGYQISQYERPLATGGRLDVPGPNGATTVGITRIHLEEDAGKSLHHGFPDSDRATYLDYNRSGVPLIEIVTEPDLRSAADAAACFSLMREILVALGVNDGNMEEGSLRCDANVSVRPAGATTLGTKAEVKNVNSFRFLQKALEFEIDRQIDVVSRGGRVRQETRLWDSDTGETMSMRSKEEAHDYRYFPEPDLPPLVVAVGWVEEVRGTLPELPDARKARLISTYALSDYDAEQLVRVIPGGADYFEAAVQAGASAKSASNWMQGEIRRKLKDVGAERMADVPIDPRGALRPRRSGRPRRHQQLGREGRLREDVDDRTVGAGDRRRRGPRADWRRGGAGRHRGGGDCRPSRSGGAVSCRTDGDVRISRRSGDEGQPRESQPEVGQRAAA